MKKVLFFMSFLLLVTIGYSQTTASKEKGVDDTMFIHVATAANISAAASYIDHPDLNANPNAILAVSHRLGTYNDKITGFWYSSGNQRWAVFNEDASPMLVNSQYNVYIKGSIANAIVHIASVANQGSSPSYTVLDEPSINGNPNPFLVLSSYWNPNGVYNNYNYGFWYDGSTNRWNIYTEDGTDIPTDAAFMVLIQPYEQGTTIVFRHEATPTSNGFYSNATLIDHPLLNNKPNASFVFTHYWDAPGYPSSGVIVDKTMGAWYSTTYNKWTIYTEDITPMVDNAVFNIVAPTLSTSASVEENSLIDVTLYPNPVEDILTITSQEEITELRIFNQLGQEVKIIEPLQSSFEIDLSDLATGIYIVKMKATDHSGTYKLMKQ